MQCPSPPHGRRGLLAVPWHGAARWLFVLACGLLLTLISAAPARAATALPHAIAVDSIAPGPAHAVAESPAASHTDQVLDRQSDRGSNTPEPGDSRDLIDEEDDDRDDDDDGQDPGGSHASPLSAEEILGQRSPSRTSEAISSDGSTLATTYLTESVRRL